VSAAAVYSAEEIAELLALSPWAAYEAARRGDTAIGGLAIRVGRRLVWPRAAVDRLLGIDPESAPVRGANPGPAERPSQENARCRIPSP
jgi:hypothetical protein